MRPNRPHISSSIQFSKSYRPTKFPTGANHLRFVESRIFRFSEQSQPLALRFRPSPSRFRFGEAVSTEQGRNPQEQKTLPVAFSLQRRCRPLNLVVSGRYGTNSDGTSQDSANRKPRIGGIRGANFWTRHLWEWENRSLPPKITRCWAGFARDDSDN